jgi:hypothetical protein
MLDILPRFCYNIIVERARKEYRLPKSAHSKSTKLSTILLNLNVRTGKKTVTG